jgi:hypothetical protein
MKSFMNREDPLFQALRRLPPVDLDPALPPDRCPSCLVCWRRRCWPCWWRATSPGASASCSPADPVSVRPPPTPTSATASMQISVGGDRAGAYCSFIIDGCGSCADPSTVIRAGELPVVVIRET